MMSPEKVAWSPDAPNGGSLQPGNGTGHGSGGGPGPARNGKAQLGELRIPIRGPGPRVPRTSREPQASSNEAALVAYSDAQVSSRCR